MLLKRHGELMKHQWQKHNREATIISMILGFTTLALFVDGLLRILGIIPPFMHIDVNILDKIADRVESDVIDKVRQIPIKNYLIDDYGTK